MHRCSVLIPFAIAALAGLLHAQAAAAQDAPTDWSKDVEKACTSPRYGLRLAASKKIAQAGDAAVPAVRAFSKDKGKDALPVALVEAFADCGGNSEPVLALLEEWAKDREFFWRAQALKGLALRSKEAALGKRYLPVFTELLDDPAWLVRVYARFGTENWVFAAVPHIGMHLMPPIDDPREETKVAALEFANRGTFLNGLVGALGDERTFLGESFDPWGRRRAQEAFTALQGRLGDGCGYRVDAKFADNKAAIDKLLQLGRAKTGREIAAPNLLADPAVAFVGGIEVLSCRNGDLFLRWTADGALYAGLEPDKPLALPAATWQRMSAAAAPLRLEPQAGVVICDRLRLRLGKDSGDGAIAPGSLPAPVADWLKQLVAAIEEAGDHALATALHDRLQQFAAR